jgi:phage terminase large subunit GpA-like protein
MPQTARKIENFQFTTGERRVFAAKEKLTVSQWAAKHRVVTSGPFTGPWRNEVTPYLVEPMDSWNLPYVRRIILMFAPQIGKTQVAFNCLGYAADQDPGPAMYVMPDEKVAKRIARKRIIPMFRSTPRLAALMSGRADDTTMMAINLQNGMDLMMAWATSAAELASESVRYLIRDEVDKFPDFSGKEADPMALAEIRTNAFPFTKKILDISTPTAEPSIISQALTNEADEVRDYQARCPVCGEYQIMEFDRIFWPKNCREPRELIRNHLANYQCKICVAVWDDYTRDEAVRAGRWVPRLKEGEEKPQRPQVIGFHLPSWYSPFVSMSRVAADFLRGRSGSLSRFMIFITQHKAEAWNPAPERPKKEDEILKAKCKLPAQAVPEAAIALTCAVDVQKSGFWFAVRAWARDLFGLTGWLIHYGMLFTWDDVERLFYETEYPIEGGAGTMRLWRAALDTGGGKKYEDMSMTEETYWWIIKNYFRGVQLFGTKGSSHAIAGLCKKGEALMKTPTGKKVPDWFHVVTVDTDAMKNMLHFGLERAAKGEENALYLHKDTDELYARHILAEERRINIKTGAVYWERVRPENHLLDADCLAVALAQPQWIGGGVNILAPRRAEAGQKQSPEGQKNKTSAPKREGRW